MGPLYYQANAIDVKIVERICQEEYGINNMVSVSKTIFSILIISYITEYFVA
jgi:hypothetical protein